MHLSFHSFISLRPIVMVLSRVPLPFCVRWFLHGTAVWTTQLGHINYHLSLCVLYCITHQILHRSIVTVTKHLFFGEIQHQCLGGRKSSSVTVFTAWDGMGAYVVYPSYVPRENTTRLLRIPA